MGWPYFCEETWLATWDNGLCASLYAPTTVRARVGDGSTISVNETTGYPFSDTIQLSLTATNSVSFPLYLRVPQWCSNSWVQVNGQTVATNSQPSSYSASSAPGTTATRSCCISRVKLRLHTWTANNNSVSVNYGPLTFSLQIQENWQPYGNNAAPGRNMKPIPRLPGTTDWC